MPVFGRRELEAVSGSRGTRRAFIHPSLWWHLQSHLSGNLVKSEDESSWLEARESSDRFDRKTIAVAGYPQSVQSPRR